jgi:hypothetical protein
MPEEVRVVNSAQKINDDQGDYVEYQVWEAIDGNTISDA